MGFCMDAERVHMKYAINGNNYIPFHNRKQWGQAGLAYVNKKKWRIFQSAMEKMLPYKNDEGKMQGKEYLSRYINNGGFLGPICIFFINRVE